MTTRSQQTSMRRWLLPFLAALVVVLAIVGLAGSVSADERGASETRVGASSSSVEVLVGPPEHIRAGQRLGTDAAGPQIVVATGVATKTATSSVDDLLRPGGSLIGKAGTNDSIRELTGGLSEAQSMFQQLSQGGKIVAQNAKLTRVELPNGGFVQLRTVMSRSPGTSATIDVNIPGFDLTKLKFTP